MVELYERDEQRTTLKEFIDDDGTGICAIKALPGMGKSSLFEFGCEYAQKQEFNVFRAYGEHLNDYLPLSILSQLMHNTNWKPGFSAEKSLDFNERIISGLQSNAGELDERTLWRVLQSWCSLVVEASHSGPVLLAIDDIHHADRPSLHVLLQLLRRSAATPISMLATFCQDAPPADPAALSELCRHPGCRVLRLGPLSQDAVRSLVADQFGVRVTPGFAAECHRATGGNPLLVKALAEDRLIMGAEADSQDLVAGESFEQAVFSLMQRTDPMAHKLAKLAAALCDSATPKLLAELMDVSDERIADLLETLTDAGILTEDLAFRHMAMRRALWRDDDPAHLAELHFRVADLQYGQGAPRAVIARHLLAAGPRHEPWVVPTLEDAARQAIAEGSLDHGINLLELALRCGPNASDRAGINATLASAAWQRNPQGAMRYLDPLTATADSGEPQGKHVIDAVRYMLWHGRLDEAADLLRRLLEAFADLDQEVRTELEAVELWLRTSFPPVLDRVGREHFARLDRRRNSGLVVIDPLLHASRQLMTVLGNRADMSTIARAEQLLRRALVAETAPGAVSAASQALLALIYAEQTGLARKCYDLLMDTPLVRASPTRQGKLSSAGADLALREGNLDAAMESAQRALDIMPPDSWGVGVGLPMSVLIDAATLMGDYDEADRLLRRPIGETLFRTRYGLHYLHARGRYYLATGAHYAALGDFLHCGQLMNEWDMDLPALVPWRSSAATAWGRLDNRSEAETLLRDELALVPDLPARSRGIALRARAELAEPSTARESLAEAVDVFATVGDRFQHAHALADLAECLDKLGDHCDAEMTRRRARKELARNGHPKPAPSRQGHAEKSGPLHNGDHRLSRAEFQVASLASDGYTNREIAARLYITMSTVEQHLTRTYRKLSVDSRQELTAALAKTATRPEPPSAGDRVTAAPNPTEHE